jgi:SAM-dependent methyltransferase
VIWVAVIVLIVLLIIGVAIAAHLLFWSRNDAPYVSTPKSVIEQIIYALDPEIGGTIIELGCGDGRLLEAIPKSNRAELIGVDNNPVVVAAAKLRVRKSARIVFGDILKTDLSHATRVYCYLSDKMMAELEPRFQQQLKPGSRVVSLQFRLPNTKPKKVLKLKDGRAWAATLYVYDY